MLQIGLKRLLIAFVLILLSFIVGTIAYQLIEGYTPLEAFYMTVITFSTVGYTEVHPLSEEGRLFTSFFIVFNLLVAGFAVSTLTSFFFEGEIQKLLYNFGISRNVRKMKNHVIVCGYGRNGIKVCEELVKAKRDFVIIEHDPKVSRPVFAKDVRFGYIVGDATLDETLKEARIEQASAIVTTLPKDAENVFITLTARELNPGIFIVARASEETSERKLYRAGANRVVMPDYIGGIHMAQIITKPYVIEFLDLLSGIGDIHLDLEEVRGYWLRPDVIGKSLAELNIRNATGGAVVLALREGGQFIFNVDPHRPIQKEDVFIVLGLPEHLRKFEELYMQEKHFAL
ncbi:potassium channel family protein [Thermonema rossianum]|uniref:potassium channel family protein n=1 Tax=Thermonema rossianum TaxID=55505 RepID=UPI00056DB72A|nr:potassium channel protein [Thermonema rossianum]